MITSSNSRNAILTIAFHSLVTLFFRFLTTSSSWSLQSLYTSFPYALDFLSICCADRYPFHLDFSLKSTSTEKTFLTTLSKACLPLLGSSLAPHLLLTLLSLRCETIICIFVFFVPVCLLHENGSFRKSDFMLTLFTTV